MWGQVRPAIAARTYCPLKLLELCGCAQWRVGRRMPPLLQPVKLAGLRGETFSGAEQFSRPLHPPVCAPLEPGELTTLE